MTVKILVELPDDISREVEIFKAVHEFDSKADAIVGILRERFSHDGKFADVPSKPTGGDQP